MKLVHIIILSVLLIGACRSGKSNATDTKLTTTLTGMSDTTTITKADTLPLIVQFYSIGEGINSESKVVMDVFLAQQEKKYNTTISYQTFAWGREGEFDCCFRLANLNKQQRKDFISELKKQFNDKSLVHVSEDLTCRYIR